MKLRTLLPPIGIAVILALLRGPASAAYVQSASCVAANAQTMTCTLPSAPVDGDSIYAELEATGAPTWNINGGWHELAHSGNVASTSWQYHVANADSATLTFTIQGGVNRNLTGVLVEYNGENQQAPVDKWSVKTIGTATKAFSTNTVTGTVSGDTPIVFFSTTASGTTFSTSTGGPTGNCTTRTSTTSQPSQMAEDCPATTSQSTAVSETSTASTSVIGYGFILLQQPGGGGGSQIPARLPVKAYVYFNNTGRTYGNGNSTAAEVQTYIDFGEGVGTNALSYCANACHSQVYIPNERQYINSSGAGTNPPSSGGDTGTGCPSGNFGANEDETWFMHGSGVGSQIASTRVVGYQDSVPAWIYFTNPGSTTWRTYNNNYVKNCTNSSGAVVDDFWGSFYDDSVPSMNWENHYAVDLNCGSTVGSQDGDNDLSVDGAWTDPTSNTNGTYITTTCASYFEYATDSALITALDGFFGAITHQDSSTFWKEPNYYCCGITDASMLSSCSSCFAGLADTVLISHGTVSSSANFAQFLDWVSGVEAKTTKAFDLLSSSPDAFDTLAHAEKEVQDQELHFASVWLGCNVNATNTISTILGGPQPQCLSWFYADYSNYNTTESFDWNNIVLEQPVQTMQAGSGGIHGAADLCVNSTTYPNCLFVRQFKNCFYKKAHFLNGTTAKCAVLVNVSGSTQTLKSGSTTFPDGTAYDKYVAFCQGGDTVCSPLSSAADVGGPTGGVNSGAWGDGPGQLDFSGLPITLGTTTIANQHALLVYL